MRKKTKRSKLIKVLKTLKIDAIVPFKEKPSLEISEPGKENEMNASQLFSFYCRYIKEDIEFVR
jgi:hypothetical protein